jgi:hypothetical protein
MIASGKVLVPVVFSIGILCAVMARRRQKYRELGMEDPYRMVLLSVLLFLGAAAAVLAVISK